MIRAPLCELPGMVLTTLLVENGVTVPFRPVHVHKLPTDANARATGPLGHWATGPPATTAAVALAAGPLGRRRALLLWPLGRWAAAASSFCTSNARGAPAGAPVHPPTADSPTHSSWHSQPPSSPRSSRKRAARTASGYHTRPCCMRCAPAAVTRPRRCSRGWPPQRVQACSSCRV